MDKEFEEKCLRKRTITLEPAVDEIKDDKSKQHLANQHRNNAEYFLEGAKMEPWAKIEKSEMRLLNIGKQNVLLHLRYVNNIEDAKKAFEESDVIYVDSHSRYGLGWALSKEGMGNPLKMQTKPIKIPKSELRGYKGKILKDLGKEVIIQSTDEDIRQIKPRKGYQIIAMASCSSGQHFLEVIKRLRQGLPTTVIYTNKEVIGRPIDILLEGLLTGKRIEQITQKMNIEENPMNNPKIGKPYETIILNAEAGSAESTQYDKYNLPKSATLFFDIPE